LETAPATEEHGGTGQAEANDQTESAALASQAKITAAQANATALGQFAGGTVNKTELDSENGTLMLDGTSCLAKDRSARIRRTQAASLASLVRF